MTREEHLLATLAEEAAEVAHAVGKALRFGPDRIWPGTGKTNRQAIEDELAELNTVAAMLGLRVCLSHPDKDRRVESNLELARKLGRVDEVPTINEDVICGNCQAEPPALCKRLCPCPCHREPA